MDYHAYLLRIWCDTAAKGDGEWRIVLQSVESGEKIVVQSLAELVPILRDLLANIDAEGD